MHDIILKDLKEIIDSVEDLQELVSEQMAKEIKEQKTTDRERLNISEELERMKKLRKSVYEDYKEELLTKEEYLSYRKEYEKKEKIYEKQLEALKDKETLLKETWRNRVVELKEIEELDREIVVEMVEKITVYENRHIKISYNF